MLHTYSLRPTKPSANSWCPAGHHHIFSSWIRNHLNIKKDLRSPTIRSFQSLLIEGAAFNGHKLNSRGILFLPIVLPECIRNKREMGLFWASLFIPCISHLYIFEEYPLANGQSWFPALLPNVCHCCWCHLSHTMHSKRCHSFHWCVCWAIAVCDVVNTRLASLAKVKEPFLGERHSVRFHFSKKNCHSGAITPYNLLSFFVYLLLHFELLNMRRAASKKCLTINVNISIVVYIITLYWCQDKPLDFSHNVT